MNWEEERGEEMRSALKKGKLPYTVDEERGGWTPEQRASATPSHRKRWPRASRSSRRRWTLLLARRRLRQDSSRD